MSEEPIVSTEVPACGPCGGSPRLVLQELATVVREATVAQDARFLEGLEYGLALAGLMTRPEVQRAWDAGVTANQER